MRRHPTGESWNKRIGTVIHRLFPERQIHFRTHGRVSFARLTHRTQIFILALFLGAASWAGFTTYTFVMNEELMAAKDNKIASVRLAYRSLLREVANYQHKFAAITKDLEENHGLMLTLVQQNAGLQRNLKTVELELKSTEQERQQIVNVRERLTDQLARVEDEMRQLSGHNFTLKGNLNSIETDLDGALAERNAAIFKSTQMRKQIKDLEGRLSTMETAERDSVQLLTDSTSSQIENMEKVIKLAGLKPLTMLKVTIVLPDGQGGPFVPIQPDQLPGADLKADLENLEMLLKRAGGLQKVMGRLPLTAPLNSFYITSGYGKRRDPINKRWAAHYGVDLGGPLHSPVYATASGIVTYVGWKGRYGKLVEVSHGSKIKTRYGHLNKTLVRRGQKVSFQQKIGLLGNTGRSTGAHLHYEVLFEERTRNPMNFIKAGRYVFQE